MKFDTTYHFINPYLKFIRYKQKNILIVFIIGGIIGFLYSANQKINYESKLTFAINKDDYTSNTTFSNLISKQIGLENTDLFSEDNIINILKSKKTINNVFLSVDTFSNKSCTLADFYFENEFRNSFSEKVSFPIHQSIKNYSSKQLEILSQMNDEFISKNIKINPINRNVSIYQVNIISNNERFSNSFTQKLLNTTNDFYYEIMTNKKKLIIQNLEKRLQALKDTIYYLNNETAFTKDCNLNTINFNSKAPISVIENKLSTYTTVYNEIFKQIEMERFNYLKIAPLIQVIDKPKYPLNQIKINTLPAIIWFGYFAVFFFFSFSLLKKLTQKSKE